MKVFEHFQQARGFQILQAMLAEYAPDAGIRDRNAFGDIEAVNVRPPSPVDIVKPFQEKRSAADIYVLIPVMGQQKLVLTVANDRTDKTLNPRIAPDGPVEGDSSVPGWHTVSRVDDS
jgi:hypothetical protein